MSLIFLSHSGIDTEGARVVKRRILDAAPAWRVWFDKDDLEPGRPWMPQIEQAIARAQVFVVYVGSAGIINFVDAEVQVALSRAVTEPNFRFIPLLSESAPPPEALPAFARQFHAVRLDDFDRLLGVLQGHDGDGRVQAETNPFFALAAIHEGRSHLFFGREDETRDLVQRVFEQPLVLVSGDSGSGKSSLVRAGLVPKFRGGALSLLKNGHPDDRIFHVVVMSPRGRPWSELGDAVLEAARPLRLSVEDRNALARHASSGDLEQARRALRCDLPADSTSVLLVVDQFEELFTTTSKADRESFVKLLVELAAGGDERFRVVLTMRHDYVNLCSSLDGLREILDADDRRARFALGRMRDADLRRVITEPLRLAGVPVAERDLLAKQILEEVGTRPGDLALVQMALTETWAARVEHAGDLTAAYASVGRVEGALAVAAEKVRKTVLQRAEHRELAEVLDSVLIRLVRLGDTGGATRRQATRGEFDDTRWKLVQLLADQEGKRLVLISGSVEQPTAEVAHEALVTAWPHLQNLLQSVAEDKRILDALIPKAVQWGDAAPDSRAARLTSGMELQQFAGLLTTRSAWLSTTEMAFIKASQAEVERQRRWVRKAYWAAGIAAVVIVGLLIVVSWQVAQTRRALGIANRAAASSLWNRLDFSSRSGLLGFLGSGSAMAGDELTALWELRRASPDLKTAFLDELVSKPDRAVRFARQPELVARALFTDWPHAEARRVFDAVMRQLASSDLARWRTLDSAAGVMAAKLAPEHIASAFDSVAEAVRRREAKAAVEGHASLDRLVERLRTEQADERFAAAVRASSRENPPRILLRVLASRVSGNAANATLQAAIGSGSGLSPAQRAAVAEIAPILAARINEAHARARLGDLRAAIERVAGQPRSDLRLDPVILQSSNLVSVLVQQIPPAEADDLFDAMLRQIASVSEPKLSAVLSDVLMVIGRRTTKRPAANATALLREILGGNRSLPAGRGVGLAESLTSKVPDEEVEPTLQFVITRISTDRASESHRPVAVRLAERVPPERFDTAVRPLFTALGSARTRGQRIALSRIVQGLAGRMNDAAVTRAFGTLLDWLEQEADDTWRKPFHEALEVLADGARISPGDFGRLLAGANGPPARSPVYVSLLSRVPMTADQATVASEAVRTAAARSSSQRNSTNTRAELERLYGRFTSSDLQAVVDRVLKSLSAPPGPGSVSLLVDEAAALSPRLTPLQAKHMLLVLVGQVDRRQRGEDLSALADVGSAVADKLDEAGARETFEPLMKRSVTEESQRSAVFARVAATLALKLGASEATHVFPAAIKGMGGRGAMLVGLSRGVEELSKKIARENRAAAIVEAQALLAWSYNSIQQQAAARALVALWAAEETEDFVQRMVDMLKYPTATESATTVFLEALKARDPNAPGSKAGLEANIEWLKLNYPAVAPFDHPDRLPSCPTPRWPGLACPGADR